MSDLHTELFFDSQKILERLKEEFRKSQKSIDIEVYIWAMDEVANEFYEILLEAAQRGVQVRILVDGFGSLDWIRNEMNRKTHPNLHVRIYHKFLGLTALAYPNKLSLIWGRMNQRDHRKIYIIDDKIAFTGSFNVTNSTLVWEETAVEIKGAQIQTLKEMFDLTWKRSRDFLSRMTKQDPPVVEQIQKSKTLFTTQTFSLRRRYRKAFYLHLKHAKKRIWMVTPYLNPPKRLIKHLADARKRNVEVVLILSKTTDYIVSSWMAHLHYRNLFDAGVKIYEHQDTFIHSKLALIDDRVIVGSGNLNYRSLYRDLEMNLVVNDKKNVQKVEEQIRYYAKKSKRVNSDYTFLQKLALTPLAFFKTWF